MAQMIMSVNDLAQLPDSELIACLAGLRSAIQRAKRAHASALHKAPDEHRTLNFHSYDWRPRQNQRSLVQAGPDRPISELGLRAFICSALNALGIFYVDDLSESDEDELLCHQAIRVKTTARLS